MTRRLNGKHALVTGATSGIGLAIAKRFMLEGARVAITGSSDKSVEQARKELGGDVLAIKADAGSVGDQKALAETVRKSFGGLEVLVVNAGIAELKPIEAWDEAAFDRSFAINVKGPFFLVQALIPLLANPSSIVLNTSINAHIGVPNTAVYGASKAALSSMIRTLSGELIKKGIRVNAVSPGPVATPLYDKLGMDENARRAFAKQIPAGRFGTPNEIAETFVYFASDASAFTVGAELTVDGGMSTL